VNEDWNGACIEKHGEYKLHGGKKNFPGDSWGKLTNEFKWAKKTKAVSYLHLSENGRFFAKA
jgi:hypothetical protein